MKKLISIGVALALLATVVLPVAVAADDPPPTYAKIPFTIVGEGLALIGSLVSSLDAKMDLGLPFDVSQITAPLADFTQGPLSYTVDMVAWGLDILAQILEQIVPVYMADFDWIVTLMFDIICKLFMPFGELEATCNVTP